jgi:palmitoyltransferase ZDHHC13/17
MAGIFSASLFLIATDWLFFVMPATAWGKEATGIDDGFAGHLVLNLLMAVFLALTTCFYGACMRFEPGFVPKMNGIADQKAVIDELLASWKYDEMNFCVTCMIRTPLRSKHCKACQRCVAKHDQ